MAMPNLYKSQGSASRMPNMDLKFLDHDTGLQYSGDGKIYDDKLAMGLDVRTGTVYDFQNKRIYSREKVEKIKERYKSRRKNEHITHELVWAGKPTYLYCAIYVVAFFIHRRFFDETWPLMEANVVQVNIAFTQHTLRLLCCYMFIYHFLFAGKTISLRIIPANRK